MFKVVLIFFIAIPWIGTHVQGYSALNRQLIFSNALPTSGDPQVLLGGSARFQSSIGPGLTQRLFEPHTRQHFGSDFEFATESSLTGLHGSRGRFGRGHFELDGNNRDRATFKTSSRTGRTRPFGGSLGLDGDGHRGSIGGSIRSLSRTYASTGISSSTRILRQEKKESQDGSYSAFIKTEDGLTWEEQGTPLGPGGAIVKKGSYTFTFPDGTLGQVSYIADENGFRPESDLIPATPAHALAQVKKAQEERSFADVYDGQYRVEDHRSNGLRGIPLLNGNKRALTDSRTFVGSFRNQFEAESGLGLRNKDPTKNKFGARTSQNTGVAGLDGGANNKYTHV